MNLVKEIFYRNKPLAWLGTGFLLLSVVLLALIPINTKVVLGLNSLIKPLKFAVSLWIYCWTMAYIISYYKNEIIKKRLIFLIYLVMIYEQLVITVQAFRGSLSHFNIETTFEKVLFNMMGVLITIVTGYTLYFAIKFNKQKDNLSNVKKAAIFYGLIIFVIAGFMGGVMGGLLSHNVGGKMGGEGLPFVDWSTKVGDIRVAHFIGIHALQIIPLVGFKISDYMTNKSKAIILIKLISIGYLAFVIYLFLQALLGVPFLSI